QSFNGVGAVLAPILGGEFILSGIEYTPDQLQQMSQQQLNDYLTLEASTIKMPYLIMAGVLVLVALMFVVNRIPDPKQEDDGVIKGKGFSFKVFRHSHVTWAVIAQFFYVGAQVCVGSFFIRFSRFAMNLTEKPAALWWGLYAMGGFMVGRFIGTWLMKYVKPAKLLSLYAVINMILLTIAVLASGEIAVYAVVAVPFFMSIMFPTIFALGIKGLGEESKIASSFIIMSIVGGALFPLIMGYISDKTGSMQNAYIVPLLCFIVILYFGLKGHRIKETN
ncbi:MAG TPA: MFS transporter, partial [Chitinophagaceae bacterium]